MIMANEIPVSEVRDAEILALEATFPEPSAASVEQNLLRRLAVAKLQLQHANADVNPHKGQFHVGQIDAFEDALRYITYRRPPAPPGRLEILKSRAVSPTTVEHMRDLFEMLAREPLVSSLEPGRSWERAWAQSLRDHPPSTRIHGVLGLSFKLDEFTLEFERFLTRIPVERSLAAACSDPRRP